MCNKNGIQPSLVRNYKSGSLSCRSENSNFFSSSIFVNYEVTVHVFTKLDFSSHLGVKTFEQIGNRYKSRLVLGDVHDLNLGWDTGYHGKLLLYFPTSCRKILVYYLSNSPNVSFQILHSPFTDEPNIRRYTFSHIDNSVK
jgi:hypothetical protein